ncbi:hypothetical protein PM082_020608 [Marasmius tenuissimus]|nr:hypothetical protein PM082_020608 [Marasmius tenuissimus]
MRENRLLSLDSRNQSSSLLEFSRVVLFADFNGWQRMATLVIVVLDITATARAVCYRVSARYNSSSYRSKCSREL